MNKTSILKVGISVLTATVILSGCVASKPVTVNQLSNNVKTVKVNKIAPKRQLGGVMFNGELITDKLGNISTFGNIGNQLFYVVKDEKNDFYYIKNQDKKIIKKIPLLETTAIKHYVKISQANDKELYIFEEYGNIYKNIESFDGKSFKTIAKNKDIHYDEYIKGKFLFFIPTNSLGPKGTWYQNLEIDTKNDLTQKLKRKDSKSDMRIFPVLTVNDNIVYIYNDSALDVLNTKTNQVKTLANKDSRIQFLKNGHKHYLRILDNPKEIGIWSKENEFDKKAKIIDLETLSYVKLSRQQLEQLEVAKLLKKKNYELSVYPIEEIEDYFFKRTHGYTNPVGFLY
ncbi:hypothetical protein GCM10012288_22080 [Malaciobacter pacificus]|uniref:Uncharacterized protein n=1 Tax=Malaciobacter pacificus TaxID=1080223 RepID=A0A5C2H8U1_9BACT|nr:hypothetical protein [Malaciobacter pacificus]QEP34739.1 hypothetical protein APAC_1643 [Malaciobacter pacificus]GGD47445.1 hypothetical protein GCM10012288_22080 [Malaciobacter pacificus]